MMWGYLQSCCGTGSNTVYRYYTDNVSMVEDETEGVFLTESDESITLIDDEDSIHVVDDDDSIHVENDDESVTLTEQPDRLCDD